MRGVTTKGPSAVKHLFDRFFSKFLLVLMALAISFLSFHGRNSEAVAANSLKILLGSWGGSGIMKLSDGSSQRIGCNGYYTGGGSQLGMVIRCTSTDQKIEIRSKLSVNANRLSGSWVERTYNAEGQISGKISGHQMRMSIKGAVTGSMNVQFSKRSQKIAIRTNNIGMSSVNITLSRR